MMGTGVIGGESLAQPSSQWEEKKKKEGIDASPLAA